MADKECSEGSSMKHAVFQIEIILHAVACDTLKVSVVDQSIENEERIICNHHWQRLFEQGQYREDN